MSNIDTLKERGDIDRLIQQLHVGEVETRWKAAWALGELGADKALDDLVWTVLKDKNNKVRRHVAIALCKIGDPDIVSDLIFALNHHDEDVRMNAAWVLGELGYKGATDVLIKALDDPAHEVRWQAATALGKIGDEESTQELVKALDHEDEKVREQAAWALSKLKDDKSVSDLVDALSHEDTRVRRFSSIALGKIDSEKAEDALIEALDHDDPDVRRHAAWALGRMKSKKAEESLIKSLEHEDPKFRRNVVSALGKLKTSEAAGPLLEIALTDEEVSWYAVKALGLIGGEDITDELIEITLHHENKWIRRHAAWILREIGGKRAVKELIDSLGREDEVIRFNAVSALKEIKDKGAKEALKRTVRNDDSKRVIEMAIKALKRI